MHNKQFLPLFVIFMLFYSCGDISKMQIPESVSIKTKATYSFSVGDFSKKISEYLSVQTLTEQMNSGDSSTKFSLYDYYPNKKSKAQEFLAEFPIAEIPIDVASYFKDMDFTAGLEKISFSRTITTPDFSNQENTIALELPDLNEIINSKAEFNNLANLNIPEYGSPQSLTGLPSIDLKISSPDFTYMKYKDGRLIISFIPDAAPSTDFTATLTVMLMNGTEIISKAENINIIQTGEIQLPLKDSKLYPEMQLSFSGSTDGGTSGKTNSYNLSVNLSSDAQLSEVSGITISNADLGEDGAIDINKPVSTGESNFVECTIETGSIKITSQLPEGWSGIECSPSISLSGGITAANTEFTDSTTPGYAINKSLSLNGKTYKNEDLVISGKISFSLENATIKFDGSNTDFSVTTLCSISKVQSLTIDMSGYAENLTYSSSEQLPSDIKTYIKEMKLKPSGLKCIYTNTLPEGNDININAKSDFFSMNADGTMSSDATDKELSLLSSYVTIIPETVDTIDFKVTMTLPGSTAEHPYYAKLTAIEMNRDYTISTEIEPVFEWESVIINTGSQAIAATIDTGLNFNSIFESLTEELTDKEFINKLEICSLPVYLYFSKPNIGTLANIRFTGKITAKSEGGSDISILDTDSDAGSSLEFVNKTALEKDGNNAIITDIEKLQSSAHKDLAELINAPSTGNIILDYNLTMADENGTNTLEINSTDFDSLSDSEPTSITITARIVFPLKLNVTDDASLNILELAGKTSGEDLFDRSEATDLDNIKKYIDVIDSMKIVYTVDNQMLSYENKSTAASIIFESFVQGTEDKEYITKYELSMGGGELKATTKEITDMMEAYPLNANVLLKLPAGTLVVPRDAQITLNLAVKINTDGSIELFGGDNK